MDLWERLCLDPRRHRVVTLVGGGGKTTLMYALAREVWEAGGRAAVTTSTHILPHPRLAAVDGLRVEELRAVLDRRGVVCVGSPGPEGKLRGTPGLEVEQIPADVVLVEGDGAHHRPLKAPGDHEPVIPPGSRAVVAAAGLDCLGKPVQAVCHRPERVCGLLKKRPDALVEPGDVVLLLSSPLGGRKGVAPHMAFRCALNKADLAPKGAEEIRRGLESMGIPTAVTSFQEKERGGQCWF